jgi:Holliday junction resolvase RusA-like endonuclease
VRFVVKGEPVAKPRPRVVTQEGRTHAYTPKHAKEWEETVQWFAAQHRPATPLDGPLAVALIFYLPRPKTVKRPRPSVRPDIDNYAKAVMDALNGVMWKDDGQIVKLHCEKRYGEPRVEIEIQEVA